MPIKNNEVSELLYQCSIGLDFLANLKQTDNSFIQVISDNEVVNESYVLVYHLQAISLLYSCGIIFAKNEWKLVAEKALDYVIEHNFIHGNNTCIIDNDESLSFNNALMAVIYYKMNKNGITYINTLKDCIHNNEIQAIYAPGTLDIQSVKTVPLGVIVLAFLTAYKYTKNNEYFEYAQKIGSQLLTNARMDSYDIWALRLLYNFVDKTKATRFKNIAFDLIDKMNNIAMASMSAFTVAITQRANIAWMDIQPNYCNKINELLKFQKTIQNLDTYYGAFTKTSTIHDIHISYSINNILSLIEYLVFVKQQAHLNIEHI